MKLTKSLLPAFCLALLTSLSIQLANADASTSAESPGIHEFAVLATVAVTDTVPAASSDGGPRAWEVNVSDHLNLRAEPSTKAEILEKYDPGTILDNVDGCKKADDGMVWCYVQKLGGGAVGYVAAKYLKPAVGPDGWAATGPDDSATRAGQGDFDATGALTCSMDGGKTTSQCDFGVARAGGGDATVVITRPNGYTRAIFFRMGIPIGADTSQADYGDFSATKEGDRHIIRVGDERYEIVEAVVLGG